MMDRFNLYPKKISNFFKDIIVRHNLDPTKLNYDSAGSLQMSRITSQEEENELIELKKKNKILEDIFAVHRKHIFKNEKKLLGALPKNGFTNLFKKQVRTKAQIIVLSGAIFKANPTIVIVLQR